LFPYEGAGGGRFLSRSSDTPLSSKVVLSHF
jgi:hypothetical protein